MPNEEDQGDGSSCISVGCKEVLHLLKLGWYLCGKLLHILCCQHAMPCKVMNLHLGLFVAVDPEPGKRFIDVWEAALYEHVHERHEVRVQNYCHLLCAKSICDNGIGHYTNIVT